MNEEPRDRYGVAVRFGDWVEFEGYTYLVTRFERGYVQLDSEEYGMVRMPQWRLAEATVLPALRPCAPASPRRRRG